MLWIFKSQFKCDFIDSKFGLAEFFFGNLNIVIDQPSNLQN